MTEQVNLTEEQKMELVRSRFENIDEDDLIDAQVFREKLNSGEYD